MPRLKMKGRPGFREISIDGGAWLHFDFYIKSNLHLFLPGEIRKVAFYINGVSADVRLTVLRAVAKEHQWEITGEFMDEGTEGPAFEKFLEHSHNRQHDTYIRWDGACPELMPNPHNLPPGVRTGQEIYNWKFGGAGRR